jgi:hypothetical protein
MSKAIIRDWKNLPNLASKERRYPVIAIENLTSRQPQLLDLRNWLTPIFDAYPNFVSPAD